MPLTDDSALVHSGTRSMSRAQLHERAARAASGYAALGVAPGDAIAILMRNEIAYLEASLAATLLGAYAVPLNWHFTAAELGYVIGDCDAKVLVVHADLLGLLDGAALPEQLQRLVVETPPEICQAFGISQAAASPPPGATDWDRWLARHEPWTQAAPGGLESIIYTSGTTGKPKGVRRQPPTPEQQAQTQEMRRLVYGLVPGVRLILPAPLYHGSPNVVAMRAARMADSLVLMPRFDAEELLALVQRHRATSIVMVPTMFVRLLRLPQHVRERYDLSSLRTVFHAAAPCPPDVKRAMIDWWGPIISEWYGTTETSAVTFCDSAQWLANPGTVGRPLPGARVEIIGDDGRPVASGQTGEVYMALSFYPDFTYHKRDEERRRIERDGLVTGGDIGYLNADGFLFLCDRKRDMIISGGVNIYPNEIEAALLSHPEVVDCAVIGIPDAEFGESVLALVVPTQGLGDAALRERLEGHLANCLARYKLPRRIEWRDQLPRDDAGKLLKRRLREPYWQDAQRAI
jgi:long-chain acyl-CoA synthetase